MSHSSGISGMTAAWNFGFPADLFKFESNTSLWLEISGQAWN
jgi:hypothetical protein